MRLDPAIRQWQQMVDEYTTCIALLHDVVEDTDTTLEQLSLLFPKEIINAVALLTHDDAVPYLDYVKAIKKDPLALKVKLADLKHNSDITRLDTIDEKALNRLEKYKKALMILQEDQPSL